jgi:hypothetical protein
MKKMSFSRHKLLKIALLYLSLCLSLPGCSYLQSASDYVTGRDSSYDICKTHAYISTPLGEFLSSRFNSEAPVRLGIIPFAAPANFTYSPSQRLSLTHLLSQRLHGELLSSGEIPIAEVMTREDWPGKREEFFTGNYSALRLARDASYDLVLVGIIEELSSLNSLTVSYKLIEVDAGVTVTYAQTSVEGDPGSYNQISSFTGLERFEPNHLQLNKLVEPLAKCIKQALVAN